MNTQTSIAQFLMLRRVVLTGRNDNLLQRLAGVDDDILSLFPQTAAQNLASVGISMIFSGVLVFLASMKIILDLVPGTGMFAAIFLALSGSSVMFFAYLSLVHISIRFSLKNRKSRIAFHCGVLVLSLMFSFVCATTFRDYLLANHNSAREVISIGIETNESQTQNKRAGERDFVGVAAGENSSDQGENRRRTNKRIQLVDRVVFYFLFVFCFFAEWAPFFVLRAAHLTDYGCLREAIAAMEVFQKKLTPSD